MTKVFSGALLRAHRKALGLTVEQLAAATSLSYSGLKKIERGEVRPSFASIIKIVDALGCNFDDLLIDSDEADERPTDLGPVTDAWVKRTLAAAPPMTEAKARRLSAALFSAVGQ